MEISKTPTKDATPIATQLSLSNNNNNNRKEKKKAKKKGGYHCPSYSSISFFPHFSIFGYIPTVFELELLPWLISDAVVAVVDVVVVVGEIPVSTLN